MWEKVGFNVEKDIIQMQKTGRRLWNWAEQHLFQHYAVL